MEPKTQKTLELADDIAFVLRRRSIEPLLIGAAALAVHRHPRQTEDLDLAIAIPPRHLDEIASGSKGPGRDVELSRPDAEDSLGGVLTVRAPEGAPVRIVNFDNSPGGGFPTLVRDAAAGAIDVEGLPVRVVGLVDLVLFKLYAGGPKSENDILELLTRNRVDLDELRRRCLTDRLDRALEGLLQRVGA